MTSAPESPCGVGPRPGLCLGLYPGLASFPSSPAFLRSPTEGSSLVKHLPSNTQLTVSSGQADLRYLPALYFLGNYSIMINEIYRIQCRAFLDRRLYVLLCTCRSLYPECSPTAYFTAGPFSTLDFSGKLLCSTRYG